VRLSLAFHRKVGELCPKSRKWATEEAQNENRWEKSPVLCWLHPAAGLPPSDRAAPRKEKLAKTGVFCQTLFTIRRHARPVGGGALGGAAERVEVYNPVVATTTANKIPFFLSNFPSPAL